MWYLFQFGILNKGKAFHISYLLLLNKSWALCLEPPGTIRSTVPPNFVSVIDFSGSAPAQVWCLAHGSGAVVCDVTRPGREETSQRLWQWAFKHPRCDSEPIMWPRVGMSRGTGGDRWSIRKIFRLPGHDVNRTKIRDSIVVIGVKQAMLVGLLSTDSDQSSSGDYIFLPSPNLRWLSTGPPLQPPSHCTHISGSWHCLYLPDEDYSEPSSTSVTECVSGLRQAGPGPRSPSSPSVRGKLVRYRGKKAFIWEWTYIKY